MDTMDQRKVVHVTPSSRFVPDKDERGTFLVDKDGELKSGTYEITIEKSTLNGPSQFVAKHSEKVTFNKYKALREEDDPLSVKQLMEKYPSLNVVIPELVPPVDQEKLKLEKQIADLQAQLAEKAKDNAKKNTAPVEQTSGAADASESGAKDSPKETPQTDKTQPTPPKK